MQAMWANAASTAAASFWVEPKKVVKKEIGGLHKWGYPPFIHFRIFHYKAFILGYPHLWKPPVREREREREETCCLSDKT